MNTKTIIILFFFAFFSQGLFSQSDKNLKSKLSFCTSEVNRLETELAKFQELLGLQTKAVQDLKVLVQDQESEIERLKIENYQLQQIAVNFVNVALKLEKEGNKEGAMEVYKILIKSYPTSLEAAAARIRVANYTSELEGYKK